MITLFFDDRHRVLLVRLSGRITIDDVEHSNKTARALLALEGQVRSIVDCTDVEGVDLESSVVTYLGCLSPVMGQEPRVFVTPGDELFGLGRMYGAHQEANGHPVPRLVRSLEEAYAAFEMADVKFEPVKDTSVLRRAARPSDPSAQ